MTEKSTTATTQGSEVRATEPSRKRVGADGNPVKTGNGGGYRKALRELQIELVKLLQRDCCSIGAARFLFVLEGRDAAGKDGVAKRFVQHLSPRETRIVALGKPSDRDTASWYFQRYVAHLPAAGEIVVFNRSWYNRAGVERVMGFCSQTEYEAFMRDVAQFEELLIRAGIGLFKYYLDITREEQERRLRDRKTNPLKQWKLSPIDDLAIEKWSAYTEARDDMLRGTHSPSSPWVVVRGDSKRAARLNLIQDFLSRVEYRGKRARLVAPDRSITFPFEERHLTDGSMAR
ncbi:MAG: polyphosphate kinase 2 [Dehalococcoidia bacterium]|nr:polyphosphate kinase 2 [Dehalococcoidia bacterium]